MLLRDVARNYTILRKKEMLNVRSMDNACFAWSVIAALYIQLKVMWIENLHYTCVESRRYPTSDNVQRHSVIRNNISINVYSIEDKQILPLWLIDNKMDKHVNLLYLRDSRNDSIRHFVWIKNLSRLVRSQITGNENRKYFCNR